MKKLTLLFALMVATGTFKAYAQVVVYNFDAPCTNLACADNCHGLGNPAVSTLNTTVIASASNFNLGPGLGSSSLVCGGSPMNGFSAGNPNNPNRARWADNWTSLATINVNDYLTLTLVPNAYNLVQLTTFSWQMQKSSTGPTAYEVRMSTDGFATYTTFTVASNFSNSWVSRTISVGLPSFSSPLEIRIYAYSSGGTAGSLRVDNVRIYANVLLTNLPIELISFTGEKVNEGVRLLWSTASEQENDYFTLFRSSDLHNWSEIGMVHAAGNSQSRIDYEYVDRSPLVGTNYYKLRQTDFDETFVDVRTIAVDVVTSEDFIVFPNPVARGQPVKTSKRVDYIFDELGRMVDFDPTSIIIYSSGVYTLVNKDENSALTKCQLIVSP